MKVVGGGSTSSVGRLDGLGNKKQISAMRREEDKMFFESWVQDMEEGEEPPVRIVMFPDLVGKAWGWERLLPLNCSAVAWSDCITYLEMYLQNNAHEQVPGAVAAIGSSIVANAEICLKKEEKLASEWKIIMKTQADVILRSKTVILSSLIKERAFSVIHTKGAKSSAAVVAAFVCIAKEADLICELLRRGADPSDYLIYQSNEIRMCALSLMDCNSSHSHAAAGAMVGITKETSRMCEWMRKNEQLLDIFSVSTPDELEKGRVIRFRILDVMISIVEKSSFPSAAAGNTPGSDMDGTAAAEPADTTGGDASDELNRQDQKITDADNSKKRKKKTKKQITKPQEKMKRNC